MGCTSTRLAALLLTATLAGMAGPASAQTDGSTEEAASAKGNNVAVLAEGMGSALETAIAALEGGVRSDGVRRMDEALRVAKVAAHVSSAGGGWEQLERVRQAVEQARHALQNGDRMRAIGQLRGAQDAAGSVRAENERRPLRLDPFRGATLISLEGRKLGEIEEIAEQGARARVGGYQDTLGFIDFGGREVDLDPATMSFGPVGALGLVFVVLADPEVKTPDDLQ